MRKKSTIVLCLFILFILSACGNISLEVGNIESDISSISEGAFSQNIVDLNLSTNNFSSAASIANENGYTYIVSSIDTSTYNTDLYYLSFDLDGKTSIFESLDLPIYRSGYGVKLSDLVLDSFEELENDYYDVGSINYSNFQFDEIGNFTGICEFYVAVGEDEYGSNKYYANTVLVAWNSNGKCISVNEKINNSGQTSQIKESNIITGINGTDYRLCDSGIAVLDGNGEYKEKYFDFINSNIISSGFSNVVILDDDHFSGIYKDSNQELHLAVFNRNNGNSGKKALVLACTGLDDDIRSRIVAFNNINSTYRIAVKDYLDVASSNEEAWSLLKEDLLNGYNPDMVLNTTGYDKYVISQLSSENRLSDLGNVIKKDSDLKGLEFTESSTRLFYNDGPIYTIIPSYSLRTIVGSADLFSNANGWGIKAYLDYASPLSGEYMIFDMDTRSTFLSRLMDFNGNWYVDYNSKEASFNSEEFAAVLEYINTLPENEEEASDIMYSYKNNGMYLLSDITCNNLGDMHLDSTKRTRGDYIITGFPCGTNEGSGVISVDRCFMIFSSSAGTNECWKFIKGFITDIYQSGLSNGIPVTVAGFEKWHDNRQASPVYADQYKYYVDGEEYIVNPPNDVEVLRIENAISQCGRMEFTDYRIKQIVFEYAEQYFSGTITAGDAAQAIDKDVEAYLSTL